MAGYPTPHIDASPCDIAKTVLMPGDPLRSEFIAKNFLDASKLFNDVRGVRGYTGYYKGAKVSVMASGMGMPSMAIYSHELFNVFGVENIIRIGSAGGISDDVKLRDIVIAMGTSTDSAYGGGFGLSGSFAPIADYELLRSSIEISRSILPNTTVHVGNVLTTDRFYNESGADITSAWAKMGVLAVEMETAALYMNAARAHARALGIFTVSDRLTSGESLPAVERQIGFTKMMTLALEVALAAEKLPPRSIGKQ